MRTNRGRFLCGVGAALALAAGAAQPGCGSSSSKNDLFGGDGGSDAGGAGGGTGGAGGDADGGPAPQMSDKIDLLLVVDNSASMGDKQALLAATLPELVARLVNPRCVELGGKPTPTQPAKPTDPCPTASSQREFYPVQDMHVGVVSSSLGGHGADSCSPKLAGSYNPSMADMAHLLVRGPQGNVPTYQGKGFLAWDSAKKASPPGESDLAKISSAFADLVVGAGQLGCGFEGTLEAAYRFLVDPDPWDHVEVASFGDASKLVGTDATVLAQRADFLRADSLVLVVAISDENDCSLNDSKGQAYLAFQVLNGKDIFHMPRATSACAASPGDKCCTSCASIPAPGCPDPQNDPECKKGTFYGDASQGDFGDQVNLRCFQQKRRFGIDFLWPTSRYATGWTKAQVPDRTGALVPSPLFQGGRSPSLLVYAAIVGVPWQDVARTPGDPKAGVMSAQEIAAASRWPVLLGEPDAWIPPGDPLMIESIAPRAGTSPVTGAAVAPPTAPAWNANPSNGHEWAIPLQDDLQYACVFPLAQPKDCGGGQPSCDCGDGTKTQNPLCQNPQTGQYGTTQYAGKGYPGLRHLAVAKALGAQAVVGSICPASMTPGAPESGYRPIMDAIAEAIRPRLAHP